MIKIVLFFSLSRARFPTQVQCVKKFSSLNDGLLFRQVHNLEVADICIVISYQLIWLLEYKILIMTLDFTLFCIKIQKQLLLLQLKPLHETLLLTDLVHLGFIMYRNYVNLMCIFLAVSWGNIYLHLHLGLCTHQKCCDC